MRPETLAWWKQAVDDLDVAKILIRNDKFAAAVFYSQQCAEKALKALYLETKRDEPQTHNLKDLEKGPGSAERAFRGFVGAYASVHSQPLPGRGGRGALWALHEEDGRTVSRLCKKGGWMGKKQVADKLLTRFARWLRKRYHIDRLILFGSRARGEQLLHSDYDIIIVSPDFARLPFVKRAGKIIRDFDSPMNVELLCYTPEEFELKRSQISIVSEALRHGVDLYDVLRHAEVIDLRGDAREGAGPMEFPAAFSSTSSLSSATRRSAQSWPSRRGTGAGGECSSAPS